MIGLMHTYMSAPIHVHNKQFKNIKVKIQIVPSAFTINQIINETVFAHTYCLFICWTLLRMDPRASCIYAETTTLSYDLSLYKLHLKLFLHRLLLILKIPQDGIKVYLLQLRLMSPRDWLLEMSQKFQEFNISSFYMHPQLSNWLTDLMAIVTIATAMINSIWFNIFQKSLGSPTIDLSQAS